MPSTNTRLTDQEIVDQVFTERDLRDDVWFTLRRLARHKALIDRVANGLTVGIERALVRHAFNHAPGWMDSAINLTRIVEAEHAHA